MRAHPNKVDSANSIQDFSRFPMLACGLGSNLGPKVTPTQPRTWFFIVSCVFFKGHNRFHWATRKHLSGHKHYFGFFYTLLSQDKLRLPVLITDVRYLFALQSPIAGFRVYEDFGWFWVSEIWLGLKQNVFSNKNMRSHRNKVDSATSIQDLSRFPMLPSGLGSNLGPT